MNKKFCRSVAIAGLILGGLAGCSPKTENHNQLFEKAAPEIKAVWDQAIAADRANDYVAASTGYRNLLAQKASLSADQITAVQEASLAMNQRLNAAANGGDAAAKAAAAKLAGLQMR